MIQGTVRMDEICWNFANGLLVTERIGLAAQVIYHGHAAGALKHYMHMKAAKKKAKHNPMAAAVVLRGCPTGGVVFVLLAWAFNLSRALASDASSVADELVVVTIGEIPGSILQI